MTDKLDTSWFDLSKYDRLSELDLHGWYKQILIRGAILEGGEYATIWFANIKTNPIIVDDDYDYGSGEEHYKKYKFNTSSVKSASTLHTWRNADNIRLSDAWEYCGMFFGGDSITREQYERINIPFDFLNIEPSYANYETGFDNANVANVRVDLTATDEQIKSDFSHWLTEYRKAIGREPSKKNLTDKDFMDWVRFRVLPYIDLTLAAGIEEKKLTDTKAARLIFPDEYDIDIVERLRKTTKPKAHWLLRDETLEAINTQLYASAYRSRKTCQ